MNYWDEKEEKDKRIREILWDKPVFPPASNKKEEEYIERMLEKEYEQRIY